MVQVIVNKVNLVALSEEAEESVRWLEHVALRKIIMSLCTDEVKNFTTPLAMYVGGCVRDSLRGIPPQPGQSGAHTDIDIATILTPNETMDALRQAGIKAIPTGYEHGTVTAVLAGVVAEITSLRADLETDGRHAIVAYCRDWNQDWRRRDFTVNAIYLTAEGALFDPAGGQADLAAGRLIFIGDPATRIKEDYLRILRFYRFSARFAHTMDEPGRAACKAQRAGLGQVSAERIGQELLKILAGPALAMVLTAMAEDKIFTCIFAQPTDLEQALRVQSLAENLHITLAPELVLAALWPGQLDRTLDKNLRLSSKQSAKRRNALLAATRLTELPSQAGLRMALYQLGEEAYLDGLLLAWAKQEERLSDTLTQQWQQAFSLPIDWPVPQCPITGKVLVARGLLPGLMLGRVLAQAEGAWIAAGYPTHANEVEQIITTACLLARDVDQRPDEVI